MMQFYQLFYRLYGIRRGDQLLKPPMPPMERLELPRKAVLHYLTSNPLDGGPPSDEFLFRSVLKPIQMAHVTQLGDTLGQPKRMPVAPDPMIRAYHTKHRRFRQMRDVEQAARDEQTLLVYNYGFLPKLYRYMRSLYSEYYKWHNVQATVWKQIAEVCERLDRHNFVVCHLPKILPSVSDMRIGTAGVNQRMVKLFDSTESLLLLELWKWFGPERAQSVLHYVPENRLDRVDLIFVESGRWFVLNLGLLNSWRKATAEELKLNPEANTRGVAADQMQRRFLRLMMSLMHARTGADESVDELPEEGVEPTEAPHDSTQPVADSEEAEEAQTQAEDVATVLGHQLNPAEPARQSDINSYAAQQALQTPEDLNRIDTAEDLEKTSELDSHIEADLRELETISQVAEEREEAQKSAVLEVVEEETLEQGVMSVCDRLADAGLLSAAEYRRFDQLSKSYHQIAAPDGKTTLDKFIQVPAQTLAITQAPELKDIPTVVDKSMLKSSLLEFDQKYIREVLHKDVAGMVMNFQRAGLAVTQYNVEKVDHVLGSYYDYTVRVAPVEGAPSTFRFTLPVLEDDGTYMANGVKYRMRKQRGDLPIRKIGPERVALTSYYGKLFVSRSTKRVNDYGQWLRNQVMAKGLDDADTSITNLHPAEVFDNQFKAPKVYSALAQGFRAFTASPLSKQEASFDLNFDHTQRDKLYGAEALQQYERNGAIVFGRAITGELLVLDTNGTVYSASQGKLTDLGSIEQLLSLEAQKAPVDFAELKVLGRTIPVGVVLGYELGLERLLKLLQVEPRRVPAGQRASVMDDEYALVFSDETLVFSRDDRMASMVLAGFNEFHRAIRMFAAHEFDRPGVYLNVLESAGPSTRYLREIDLLYRLFIDPITRDLLVEMKEPTNFRGLLMRSCELLLTDDHPDELDAQYMRIKGYERMAGAVYSEIVAAVRSHKGRSGKNRLPIDLNPYAVWKLIAQDPAVMLVQDINPIENLKDLEAVTYSGVGGRSSRSMTKSTRVYHQNDMGTISESTKDSSDVGINTYTSANPQFTSLRGISRPYKHSPKDVNAASLLSTSALVSPGSDRDD